MYTATPWEWHVPVCVAAMNAASTPPPKCRRRTRSRNAGTGRDCRKARRHCVMMENCCYDRREMMVLNMVRARTCSARSCTPKCGYLHDLRDIKFASEGEGLWRRATRSRATATLSHARARPDRQRMEINRGDRFDYLVSMSGPRAACSSGAGASRGRRRRATRKFVLGDVNVSLIRTALGRRSISSTTPTCRDPTAASTACRGRDGILERLSRAHPHRRAAARPTGGKTPEEYYSELEHPLWEGEATIEAAGHGGMDYIEDCCLIFVPAHRHPDRHGRVRRRLDWSVVPPHCRSARSLAAARPVEFPDFTRGLWKQTRTLHVMEV